MKDKRQQIQYLSISTGYSSQFCRIALDSILTCIKNQLAIGNRIEIERLGTFFVAKRSAATRRNPRTQAVVVVPARQVPSFRPNRKHKRYI